LRDPLRELRNVKQLLKKNGCFIGAVPFTPQNAGRLEPVIKKSVFNNLHLFHFNTKSIFNLLKKANFSDVEIERQELKSIFRKFYSDANIYYLHPSYERKFTVKFWSFLQVLELSLKSFLGKPTTGARKLVNLDSEWVGPNDWILFCARG
ncbi:hypothetical protein KAW55_05135, partial [bacterium]|nr:hypothetical protein [bacterium]